MMLESEIEIGTIVRIQSITSGQFCIPGSVIQISKWRKMFGRRCYKIAYQYQVFGNPEASARVTWKHSLEFIEWGMQE